MGLRLIPATARLNYIRPQKFVRHFGKKIQADYIYKDKARRNMLVHLQIIGTGSTEVSPSIFLFTETNRYLFNCSESFQTACYEHSIKFTKIRNVFITRMNWENVGGLPGLLMSLRDRGVMETSVYGPTALHGFKSASSPFLVQETVRMKIQTCIDVHTPVQYTDEDLTVKGYEVFGGDAVGDQFSEKRESAGDRSPEPKRPCLEKGHVSSVVFYIGQLSKTRGKFHLERAKLLGLPPGPIYKELARGNTVTAPNGRVINPHEVVDPDLPGPSFIILECPSIDFIPRIIHHPQLKSTSVDPNFIIHIAPKDVIESSDYKEWMQTFSNNVQNIFVHREVCKPEILLRSCFRLQLPLNLIDSDYFRLPMVPYTTNHSPLMGQSHIVANSLMKLHLKPVIKCGLIEDNILQPFEEFVDDTVKEIKTKDILNSKIKSHPELQERFLSASTSTILAKQQNQSLLTESSVTFLGTASASPSKYRSLSAILVHLPNNGYMFLDCGEGTISQLYKCFGEEHANHILCNLKCIFVSHIHGDHHLGLIRILQRRLALFEQKSFCPHLVIIGPNLLRRWLEDYRRSCDHISFWYQNAQGFLDHLNQSPTSLHSSVQELGFTGVCTVPVLHIHQSYGIVLYHREGWKLVYSGDTRPCDDLVKAGIGADLLIHEATFDDSLQEEAVLKKHSTLTDAVEVSSRMKAKFMICTHFSQRYPKFSTAIISNASASRVAVAFDFMTVPIAKVDKLHRLQPLIHDMFSLLVENDEYAE